MPNPQAPNRHYSNGGGSPVLVKRAQSNYDQACDRSGTGNSEENTRMKKRLTVNEVAELYLSEPSKQDRTKSPDAFKRVAQLCEIWGDRYIDDIHEDEVDKYFRKVARTTVKHKSVNGIEREAQPPRLISNATYNNYVTYYKALFFYARDKLRAVDYVHKVSTKKEKERTNHFTPEQLQKLFSLLDKRFPLKADLARLGFYCGQRHEQIVHLRIDQVAPDCSYLLFTQDDTKNGNNQMIPLSEEAQDIVRKGLDHGEYMQKRYPNLKGKIEHVFVQESGDRNVNGKPCSRFLTNSVRKHLNEMGFEGARFHDLRHSFATVLRQQGTDMKTIQRLGGWESEAAMSRYLHVTTPELATAANNLSKVLVQ